jgi:hypothetical protein
MAVDLLLINVFYELNCLKNYNSDQECIKEIADTKRDPPENASLKF